jgi:hypothetical protein
MSVHSSIEQPDGVVETLNRSASINEESSAQSQANSKASKKLRIINLANELLSMCHFDTQSRFHCSLPKKITKFSQLNSDLFVFLYENICGSELVGELNV